MHGLGVINAVNQTVFEAGSLVAGFAKINANFKPASQIAVKPLYFERKSSAAGGQVEEANGLGVRFRVVQDSGNVMVTIYSHRGDEPLSQAVESVAAGKEFCNAFWVVIVHSLLIGSSDAV